MFYSAVKSLDRACHNVMESSSVRVSVQRREMVEKLALLIKRLFKRGRMEIPPDEGSRAS